jgi:hypothetical protein
MLTIYYSLVVSIDTNFNSNSNTNTIKHNNILEIYAHGTAKAALGPTANKEYD